eukprot:TRINITY_DN4854_c0_g1_i1.p1 TRINITY_DN4854_c0_g1~~TRINITY_DN4854_c0_g1_i1.p1  ORF type:complete len:288 (+),score=31.68 TRINITY_DN4854_c0_g1_i1:14-877(+)
MVAQCVSAFSRFFGYLILFKFFFFFFKQKTAYEIMPSLVGSEMCIRDRQKTGPDRTGPRPDRGSISSMIRKFGAFSEAVTKKYAKQILEGLEYLHTNHIVHRDIKGANILVDEKGNCKLADFGSAKMNVIFYEQQQYNSIKGTINFMAPEVIKQKGSGRYADIWSLGCTVYEMLTGSPPWSQYQNQIYALMQIASSKQGPQIPSNLSSESKDFLSKCFQIEPKKRWNVYKLLRHPFIKNQLDDQISSQQQNYAHGMHKATSITQSQLMMLNKLEERAQQKIDRVDYQ